jgi:hypothetical protein
MLSYGHEPRRLVPRGAGAGDRERYAACSPSLNAMSVMRFRSPA